MTTRGEAHLMTGIAQGIVLVGGIVPILDWLLRNIVWST